jgi:hypothetical protein
MFWHAPALVFWHDLPPVKSLFFSIVACFRNFWAFTLFGIMWMGVMVLSVLAVTSIASLMGSPDLAGTLLFPMLMLVASMFFTSLYFTFCDCFTDSVITPI